MTRSSNMVQQATAAHEREVGLIELIIAVAKRKKRIFAISLGSGVLALCVSFALPNYYKASTKLLPPQQAQSGAAALLSQLGSAGIAAGVAGLKSPNDLYIAMLKSRTIGDRLVEKYKLKDVYDTPSQEQARRALAENSLINSGKDGTITIEVEGKDKKLVAQLANGYTQELLQLAGRLAITQASQRRLFFERQLEISKDNLAKAEMSLKGVLDTRGVISVDGESRAIVENIGRLRAQISATEIQLDSMRAFMTENNPAYQRLAEELKSQRAELSRLGNGRPEGTETTGKQVGLENIQLLRDVKYHQMLYELLSKQFELSRLDEAQEPSIIQVLDAAVEPERKFKPARSIIAVLASVLAALATIAWVFFTEVRRKISMTPEGEAQLAELKASLQLRA